jgi:integrase
VVPRHCQFRRKPLDINALQNSSVQVGFEEDEQCRRAIAAVKSVAGFPLAQITPLPRLHLATRAKVGHSQIAPAASSVVMRRKSATSIFWTRDDCQLLPQKPCRVPNSELRPREYLTEKEIERLQDAARKRSRYGHRDATMILIAYRHGLRASEVCGLRWDQIDLNSGRLHVRRAKGGIDNVHPMSGREIRALRQLRRENMESRYVFVTERGGPATTAGFLKTIARTGEAAKLPFPIHPHMLRHSTGYKLANDGHDTRALQH